MLFCDFIEVVLFASDIYAVYYNVLLKYNIWVVLWFLVQSCRFGEIITFKKISNENSMKFTEYQVQHSRRQIS